MFKKIIVFTALISVLLTQYVVADPTIKIAILPFNTISDKPQPALTSKIISMLKEKIIAEGAQVLLVESGDEPPLRSYSDFQEFGIKHGADYILSGTIFVAGNGYSIDSKLVNVYEYDSIVPYYADAKGSENLLSAISNISKEVISEIFQKIIITDIEIKGNQRIESDAILRTLDTQPGDIVKPVNISRDLKKIYKMGYFDDVIVEQKAHDKGVKIIYKVAEKPSVRKIGFKNNHVFEEEELAELVDTRTGSILNLHKINSDVKRIRLTYTDKNYHNCKVSYEIVALENSQADIYFKIEEGNKLKVEKITFDGNQYFSEKQIEKAMETDEKGFFSFFTSSGDLNEIEVKNDVVRIESLYKNNGFIDAKVSDPVVDIGKEAITIHFNIEEGKQFTVSQVGISGDLIVPKNEILELIQSQADELFNRENIRKDILVIGDFYSDRGFANAAIKPMMDKDINQGSVQLNYSIEKKDPVYFNRVNISGNSKTRDKVIRREVKIEEQDLYSKKNIQQTYKNISRLDYFQQIEVNPAKTRDPDKLDLNISVVEKETGTFSVGGGYSSDESAFFMVETSERNLFGKGQTGKVSARLSGDDTLFTIGMYEPYLFDTRVSAGFELYRGEKEYDYYDKDSNIGFSGTLGYKLFDFTRVGVKYNIEDFEISNVDSDETYMTEGDFLESTIKPFIQYDSRDDRFLPTEGMKHVFSIEFADGIIGSDIEYTKFLVESSFYYTVFWDFTLGLHGEGGYIDDRSSDSYDIDYKKFYLGGIQSIRGFDSRDIDASGDDDDRERGGEKYMQFNVELTKPLTDKYPLVGVIFYDRGDVYRHSEDLDFGDQYSSAGMGVRWNSPLGPLRIEYGWVLEGKDLYDTGDGQFAFSIGTSF